MAINRLNKDKVPVGGSTDTRPSSPAIGDTHYNGTLGRLEIYTAQGWMALNAPAATPTGVTATDAGSGRAYNNGSASVAFTPATTGGLPTSYVVTSSPGSYTATGSSSPIIVSGQQSSTQYTYTVVASNDYSTAATSSASSAVTATTIPQPPTIGAATAGNTLATVAYTANGTGGLSNTYTATSSPGGFTGTGSSPITISGLTNGTSYTFTVTATNANGTSAASSASSSVTPDSPPLSVDYLVIAGGGGAGGNQYGGGGGAGGYRTTIGTQGGNGTLGSALNLSTSTNYTVTVGAGGTAIGNNPTNGSNSVFSTITSLGGGYGNYGRSDHVGAPAGANGGSGGGGGGNSGAGGSQGGGSGTANQGTNGATGGSSTGGGGGGAGVAGTQSGVGGNGLSNSITGSAVTRGGGGAGNRGTAGSGGGGEGNDSGTSNNGTVNTGGGGGGSFAANGNAGVGGSGIVIFRYPSFYTVTIGAGLTGSTQTVDSNKVTTITAGTGNVSWT